MDQGRSQAGVLLPHGAEEEEVGAVPSCSREEGRTKEGAPSLQPQGEAVPPLGLEGGQGSGIC